MLTVELFTDPACPFAFSAEPIRQRLRWQYGGGLEWKTMMIALTREPGEAERLAEGAPIAAVSRGSGISENTIRKGIREIDTGERLEGGRVRRRGGGRKPIGESDPELIGALERLVADDCRGDPSGTTQSHLHLIPQDNSLRLL
jgi:hypothetical protein